MWGESARAHVNASFVRWCLRARSSIADQGVILVISLQCLIRQFHMILTLKSNIYLRPPHLPTPVHPACAKRAQLSSQSARMVGPRLFVCLEALSYLTRHQSGLPISVDMSYGCRILVSRHTHHIRSPQRRPLEWYGPMLLVLTTRCGVARCLVFTCK